MFGSIVSGMSSLLSGGATGIIGSIVTNTFDFFEQSRKNKQEIKRRELDIQEMDKEYEHRKEISAQKQEAETQETSYDHDTRAYTSGMKLESPWIKVPLVIVDTLRGVIRPALTLVLVYLTWRVFDSAHAVLEDAGLQTLEPSEAMTLVMSVVDMILYLTSTAVTWWFGTRPRSKKND